MSKAEQLKLDIGELNLLIQLAHRQRCKDVLGIEVRKVQTELSRLPESKSQGKDKPVVSSLDCSTKCYEVKLNNYGWDQSDEFVKIYVELKNVQTLGKGAVYCNFTKRSIDLCALGLENRNYQLPIRNFCEEIEPTKSYIKIRTNMITVFLAKKITNRHWSHVTGVEKRIKEAKTAPPPDLEKGQDAEGNLTNMMKKMYQDGDNDIKRMIAKAWTESQEKGTPALPDFPPM